MQGVRLVNNLRFCNQAMRKVIYGFISALLLLSLLFSGCQTAPGRPLVSAAEGVLNLAAIDPITLDPAVSGEMTSHEYIMQIFSGLVRFNEKLEPTPDIAQSWQISNGGKTYTFNLRKDVKFHNGREVKAGDFKYSWERAANPSTGSRTAPIYLGDIIGVKEVLGGKVREISGVRVIDDYTLEVDIDAPKAYFLSKLSYPTSFVVDRKNVESSSEWWQQPNGTGPFRLKQWTKGSLLVLERNELYYGEKAEVNQVVFQLLSGVPVDLYETGKIDVTSIDVSYIDRVTDKAGPFYQQLKIVPQLSFGYIGFNATNPPFDDVNIRRAFAYAIDRDRVISLVFRDMVQRADGILPPGMPGFNKDLSGLRFDVAKAKQLIAASKYGDVSRLPPITITTSGLGGLIGSGLEAIIHEWRQNLGVEVKVRQLEPERFLYYLKDEKDEMFDIGWVADYPHPQNFLDVLFHTDTEYNYGEYSNPAVDALLDRAGVEPNSKLSLEMYQEAEQMLVNDVACLLLWFGKEYVLVKPYVSGYEPSPMGVTMLNRVSVQPH